jgi:hypothetical protein
VEENEPGGTVDAAADLPRLESREDPSLLERGWDESSPAVIPARLAPNHRFQKRENSAQTRSAR